jgi:16S rRNA (guanine527-N7)-methyltransferase
MQIGPTPRERRMKTDDQLEEGAQALGLALRENDLELLARYCALIEKWNRVYNLTAIRERAKIVSHHLLDCLAVAPHLPADSLADVGSGAGLPGIPLAIARPGTRVVLLESNHKKGAFLRQAVLELGLANVQVVIGRAEEYGPVPRLAMAISRAFSDLTSFVEASRHLVDPGGWLLAMKGVYPDEELAQLPADVEVESIIELTIPGVRAARHLVRMRVGTRK